MGALTKADLLAIHAELLYAVCRIVVNAPLEMDRQQRSVYAVPARLVNDVAPSLRRIIHTITQAKD
jgi:hypothetical protein